ncbi:TfoX/Sxy family protein [Ruminococcus albus]|nr:TfoX/Sxy family protein [Ruminococcus albus]MCC3351025.1 TfoX/Sxy family protein [Ruminococcus albus 8]
MPSSKQYLEFVLEMLSDTEEISYRPMMGEYIIYCRGKVVGGIYDDRFLVKKTRSAALMMPDAPLELPYDGAKEMLLVENVDSKEFLHELLPAVADELPAPKKRKKSAD